MIAGSDRLSFRPPGNRRLRHVNEVELEGFRAGTVNIAVEGFK
jgi:hypothetical protein